MKHAKGMNFGDKGENYRTVFHGSLNTMSTEIIKAIERGSPLIVFDF